MRISKSGKYGALVGVLSMLVSSFALGIGSGRFAQASAISYGPGQTLTLSADLVMSGSDTLDLVGTAQNPCLIEGNGHRIVTNPSITGHVVIQHCTIHNLGTVADDGLRILLTGSAYATIEDNTFDASSSVYFYADANSTIAFNRNTVLENSIVPIVKDAAGNRQFFWAEGGSQVAKSFKGNHVYKSYAIFNNASHWMIGGATDAESNIFIGYRAGIGLTAGQDNTVKGNYLYALMPINQEFPYWTQVSTMGVAGNVSNLVIENNVIRHGEWNVRGLTGQFRNNVALEMASHSWISVAGSDSKIHHNIFALGAPEPNQTAGITIQANTTGVEIYNNTFDGGGTTYPIGVPVIELGAASFVDSIRSNVFYNFSQQTGVAAIENGSNSIVDDASAARVGYTDYNLFYNPFAQSKINYITSVSGKTMRAGSGFGLHDAHVGGALNEQVDPKFKGPVLTAVPFANEDVKSGAVTVSQILAYYRDVYTPAAGSPLIDAGDPADGAGTDIGAVDAGAVPPVQVAGKASVTLVKSVSATQANAGDQLTYTITYRNIGNAQAAGVKISDQIPAGTTYVAGSASAGAILNGDTLSWTLPTLDAGSVGTVSFKVKAP